MLDHVIILVNKMTIPFMISLFIFTSLVFMGLYVSSLWQGKIKQQGKIKRQGKVKRQGKKNDYSQLILTYLELLKCNLYIDSIKKLAALSITLEPT